MKKVFAVLIALSFGFSIIMGSSSCNSGTTSSTKIDTSGTSGSGQPGRIDSTRDSTLVMDSALSQ